ncbi:uncharacterized protein SCHCODRAFT_02597943 [Schizophyllum commune H4-8]|uniref:F-box domain-containing protein n=1 Tax=Schizophyllum commune (strain H4-8 / FGSC 9210) TaxID=578458 RepID=D8PY66_SCHCM|nr:uncharacterized protein SCHCODRAFT_02597943 [Schizophyllum commune H4-8]KAI5897205.1 hypothetical protein SCHCODRAFT_02597943 [Schizophyllum commune H4-8]
MSDRPCKLTSLPLESLLLVADNLPRHDLGKLSETNMLFACLTRRERLREFVMSPRSFVALEKWVHVGALYPKICACPANVQEDFGSHVKSIVLPEEWTSKTRALFVLLNHLAPSGLQSIRMRSHGSKSWWTGARQAWGGYDNGQLFAPIKNLTLECPNLTSIVSLFSKQAPSTRQLLAHMPLTLTLRGAPADEDSEMEWGVGFGGGWGVQAAPVVQWTDDRDKIVLRTRHLNVEVNTGMERVLDTVYFFQLHSLNVYTRIFSDWTLTLRLLRDSQTHLQSLRIYGIGSRGQVHSIEPVFLGSLTNLHIDWELLAIFRSMARSTVVGQVTLTIHKYVADYATDAEFDVAAEVLTTDHWSEIVVVEDEFWGTPDAITGQAIRRADFVARAQMQNPPTYVTNFV